MPVPKSIRTPIPNAQRRRRVCLNTSPDYTLVGYLGYTATEATRITALPARAELISLSGDDSNLTFSFRGQGQVTIDVPSGSGFQIVGADSFQVNGNKWNLVFNTNGLHSAIVIPSTPEASFIKVTSTKLSADVIPINFAADPGLTDWKLLGSDNISADFTTDLTPQASISESPADSGNYSAIINGSTMGGSHFFRVGMDGLVVVP